MLLILAKLHFYRNLFAVCSFTLTLPIKIKIIFSVVLWIFYCSVQVQHMSCLCTDSLGERGVA